MITVIEQGGPERGDASDNPVNDRTFFQPGIRSRTGKELE